MLGFLFGVVGLGLMGFGVYRASSGTRAPLSRGAYQKAAEVLVTSLLAAVAGLMVFVFAVTGSVIDGLVALVVGGVLALGGGRMLYRGMIRQVQGRR